VGQSRDPMDKNRITRLVRSDERAGNREVHTIKGLGSRFVGLQPTGLTRGGVCGEGGRAYLRRSAGCLAIGTGRFARAGDRAAEVSRGHSSRVGPAKARTVGRSLKGGLLMGSERQNNQLELAFGEAVRGEAPNGLARGTEDPMARPAVEGSAAPPGCVGGLMEVIVARRRSCHSGAGRRMTPPPNRRVRTRTHGGGGGAGPRGSPLSRSSWSG